MGLEPTLELYIDHLLQIVAELKRILKKGGILFWNHGDSYASSGSKRFDNNKYGGKSGIHCGRARTNEYQPKCMLLQNFRLITEMIDEQGWILRNTIIWHKSNPMPSSVKDRLSNTYEPVFVLVKSQKYYFDLDAIRQPMKNPGDVWTLSTQPFKRAHFATFPEKLVKPMIKAGCPQWICKKCGKVRERIIKHPPVEKSIGATSGQYWKVRNFKGDNTVRYRGEFIGWTDCNCQVGFEPGIVLDPFSGAGTTCLVAKKLGRNYIGIEKNPDYVKMAQARIKKDCGELF